MILVDVYKVDNYLNILYNLLEERQPWQSISHEVMPDFDTHKRFVESKPYYQWLFMGTKEHDVVGSIYLTNQHEIGISVFDEHKGKGYGSKALEILKKRYPIPLYANINPENVESIAFFKKHGARLIQHTYKL